MSALPVPIELQVVINDLAHGRELSSSKIASAFDVIMRGDASAVQVASLLTGLRVRGETAEVIAGVATSLRRAMNVLEADSPDWLVDTCGTGGGEVTTFNISTASAIVAAGAGVPIAKHGNRSFTSRSGSADVLEALGVNIDVDTQVMVSALREAGIVFMFAPRMHPAMRHVGPIRRELAIPTVMNVVGPLANPANAGRQVIGVADASRLEVIAESLCLLGTVHSLVVHGEPGMDEISPVGETTVLEIRNSGIERWSINPADYGYSNVSLDELAGGSPEDNAAIIEEIFRGGGKRGARAAVVLNAGAAIYISGILNKVGASGAPGTLNGRVGVGMQSTVTSFADGVRVAEDAINSGAAASALNKLRAAMPKNG